MELSLIDEPILLSESLLFPVLEEVVEDLADLVSEVLAVVLVPDFALVAEDLESEAEVILPLLDELVDPEEAEGLELMPPWPEEPIVEPL